MKKALKTKTRPPSSYEQNVLLPILMKGFEKKKEKMNAVTNRQIVNSIRKHGLKINARSVKILINYIRTNDLMTGLMATSTGYYMSNNEQELMDYESSLLSREVELRKVRMSIKRQRRAMFSQLSQMQTQIF